MAKPPIIISNGGLLSKLASTKWGQNRIKNKIQELADDSVVSWIETEDGDPFILWYLKNEKERFMDQNNLNELARGYGINSINLGDEIIKAPKSKKK